MTAVSAANTQAARRKAGSAVAAPNNEVRRDSESSHDRRGLQVASEALAAAGANGAAATVQRTR